MTDPIRDRYSFTREHAMDCAKMALRWFRTLDAAPESKSDGSPVTIADRSIERELRDRIAAAFPDDAILGEEFDTKEGTSGYEWVLDPIDGTLSFVQGVPLFGTMIAVLHEGKPVVGAIAMPCLDEMVIAASGIGGSYIRPDHDDTPLTIEDPGSISHAIAATTTPECFRTPELWGAYEAFTDQALRVRGWSDCYAFVLLVTGRVHLVVENGVNIWDLAAVPPLVEAAGGVWSDFDNDQRIDTGSIIASAASIHPTALGIIDESKVRA